MKLKYTTASAVKEKEGKLKCQAEVLCEGTTKVTQIDTSSNYWSGSISCIIRVIHTLTKPPLSPSGLELPRINYDINSKRHRFVYGNCVEESALSKQVTAPIVLTLAFVNRTGGNIRVCDLLLPHNAICQEQLRTCRLLKNRYFRCRALGKQILPDSIVFYRAKKQIAELRINN